ncbi:MAG: hypothetical protein CFE28_13705 [Alphaproteobacteria bacterium PA2]|nr:MAG: hypothetical protein CFE28_13705 [Alphaproteobacteria bacterium PA2]
MSSPSGLRIFFSYTSADRERVAPIVHALTQAGHTVWWDRHIAGGAAYAREIEAALEACQVVIVAWSKTSLESDWVRDEAAYGRDRKRLLPLRLDQVEPPLGFRQYQTLDLSAWSADVSNPAHHGLLKALDTEGINPPGPGTARTRFTASRRGILAGVGGLAALAGAGAWWTLGRGGGAPPHSIAVLPFANLSGDLAQDYFSDGLSEELINALARIKLLQVVARTSAFKFKGSTADSGEIGARLGVAHLLDGSVRRADGRVRVSAQLVEARTGFEKWSQTFDRDLKDILAVQSEIAQAVAEAMKVHLLGDELARVQTGAAANAEAFDAYLKGKRLFDAGGDEAAYRAALSQFDTAIGLDPNYAAAHAGRARVLMKIGDQYSGPSEVRATYDAALVSARQSVELAPSLPEAQAALGGVLSNARLDFKGARQAYAQAMESGSGDADILTRVGLFNCWVGDLQTGLPAVRRAAVLDPLNPRVHRALGLGLIYAHQYAQSIEAMKQALSLNPKVEGAHGAIGDALLLSGDARGALASYSREPLLSLKLAGEAIAAKKLGQDAAADKAFAALKTAPGLVTDYQQAQVLAQWGDSRGAVSALENARRNGDSGIALMKADPLLDPIRRVPEYLGLLSDLGLSS